MTLKLPDDGRTDAERASAVLGLLAGRRVLSVLMHVASDFLRYRDLVDAIASTASTPTPPSRSSSERVKAGASTSPAHSKPTCWPTSMLGATVSPTPRAPG
jgi:hypothetical protein